MHESESESGVAQSCPTLSDPMDCSLPGSSVHGILQARALEWGAVAFSAPQPYTATNLLFVLIDLSIMDILYMWGNVFKIYPCVARNSIILFFMAG